MRDSRKKVELAALAVFLIAGAAILTNGFSGRIFAQEQDRFEQVAPLAEAIAHILNDYVYEPDVDHIVEFGLSGIMQALDRNSSYITSDGFDAMRDDTEGAFDGIGVHIRPDEQNRIVVFQPMPGSPAAKAGMMSGDILVEIDGVTTEGMGIDEAARRIKGPRGQKVQITVLRPRGEGQEPETVEFNVERGTIPLESVVEARIFTGKIGYIRVSDFKKTTANEVRDRLKEFKDGEMSSLILDLRWNPGGLLSASREVSELFLPRGSLVTYTRGRKNTDGSFKDEMRLRTERRPVVPEEMPLILLVGGTTASSAEIVTGALQFHQRAIVVGEKTFGKGSVQTIIPMERPEGSALRLTTALYYTPADVTIDHVGIRPDVEVVMTDDSQKALLTQLGKSWLEDATKKDEQNHGPITGAEIAEGEVDDAVLARAVEIIKEGGAWSALLERYHRDVHETQVAAVEGQEGLVPR
ncbi:MAG: S41 family peptidase [Candidatus Hydrogenedentota bacterium]